MWLGDFYISLIPAYNTQYCHFLSGSIQVCDNNSSTVPRSSGVSAGMSTSKVKVPQFDSVKKPYKRYLEEIEYWQLITKSDKKERAVHLAYELPDQNPSDIKDKLFVELGKEVAL